MYWAFVIVSPENEVPKGLLSAINELTNLKSAASQPINCANHQLTGTGPGTAAGIFILIVFFPGARFAIVTL